MDTSETFRSSQTCTKTVCWRQFCWWNGRRRRTFVSESCSHAQCNTHTHTPAVFHANWQRLIRPKICWVATHRGAIGGRGAINPNNLSKAPRPYYISDSPKTMICPPIFFHGAPQHSSRRGLEAPAGSSTKKLAATSGRRHWPICWCCLDRGPGSFDVENATTLSWSSAVVSEWVHPMRRLTMQGLRRITQTCRINIKIKYFTIRMRERAMHQ